MNILFVLQLIETGTLQITMICFISISWLNSYCFCKLWRNYSIFI